jgi:hypothetical protein
MVVAPSATMAGQAKTHADTRPATPRWKLFPAITAGMVPTHEPLTLLQCLRHDDYPFLGQNPSLRRWRARAIYYPRWRLEPHATYRNT